MKTVNEILARCDRSGGVDACWPWLGAKQTKGYGTVSWHGKARLTHRLVCCETMGLAWESVPTVRHTCDNPPCCNPKHLVAGTALQNMEDKVKRGRCRNYDKDRAKTIHGVMVSLASAHEIELSTLWLIASRLSVL